MADAITPLGDLLQGEGDQTWSSYANGRGNFWATDALSRMEALLGRAAPDYVSGWVQDDGQGINGSAVVIVGTTMITATITAGERSVGQPRSVEVSVVATPLTVAEIRVTQARGVRVDLVPLDRDPLHLPIPPGSNEPEERLLAFLPSLVQRLGL